MRRSLLSGNALVVLLSHLQAKQMLRKSKKEAGREKNHGTLQSARNLNGLSIGLKRISENIPSK